MTRLQKYNVAEKKYYETIKAHKKAYEKSQELLTKCKKSWHDAYKSLSDKDKYFVRTYCKKS